MQSCLRANWTLCILTALAVSCGFHPLFAQNPTLSVPSATGVPGSNLNLPIYLEVLGQEPAGVQWAFSYSQAQISAIYVTVGPAAAAAGKTVSCSAASGQYTCLVAGPNAQGIGSGILATAQITLAPTAVTSSLMLLNMVAVDPAANPLGISVAGTATIIVPVISAFSCAPAVLSPGNSASCLLTLSSGAPARGMPVELTTSTPLVTVPPYVTIPAGEISTSFSAGVLNAVTMAQSATLTATCGGSVSRAAINLLAGSSSGGLAATPSSLLFEVSSGHTASQNVALTGLSSDNSFGVTSVTANGSKWLSVLPASGSGGNQVTLSVMVDPTGLAAGSYPGSVTVSINGEASVAIAVMMNVTATGQLTASPAALSFTYDPGNPGMTPPGGITVFSNPEGADFAAAADQGSRSWLTVGSGGAFGTPGSFSVSVAAANLAPGLYHGQIRVTSSVSDDVQIPVTLNVVNAAPKLLVPGPIQRFALVQEGGQTTGEVVVTNAGGGTLHFAAQIATGTGNWLTLSSGATGSATIASPASLGFTLNPVGLGAGVYTGRVVIQNTDSQAESIVTIIMAVSTASGLITVSQRGLTFTSVAGGPPPPNQSLSVVRRAAGAQALSVQTGLLPNAESLQSDWLNATSTGDSEVTVSVNQSGLSAGQYYGSIAISDTSAANSPVTVSVMLDVLPATQAGPVVQLLTGGLVFTGKAGSQTTQQQQVAIFNPMSTVVTWSAATYSSPSGLVTTSPNGTLLPGANTVQVQVDFSTLPVGVQNAMLSLAFSDGTLGTVHIEVIASEQVGKNPTSPQISVAGPRGRALYPKAQASACEGGNPALLLSVFQSPSDGTTIQAGIAQAIRVHVLDDCGNALAESNGDAVRVIFTDGEIPLTLHDIGGGFWEAAWVPVTPIANLTLQAVPFAHGTKPLILTGTSIGVAVQLAAAEIEQISGVVNAALGSQAPLNVVASGSYVAMYGTGLSSGSASTLSGTQVLLGGMAMPLLYAAPTQLNAIVPDGLNPNTEYDLTIVQGFTRSIPVPLILTSLQPGIYTTDSSGTGQGVVEISGTALLAAPASDLSRPAQRGGEFVTAYCTGLGPVLGANGEMPPSDGAAAPENIVYHTTATTTATIGGVDAAVEFSGLTPTLVGVYQVNIKVPAEAPTGNAVPLVINIVDPRTGVSIQSNAVTMAIQ